MPRNVNTTIQNNFTGGLITQATALNFPPNAAIAANNCIFSEIGTVSKRPGFEFENNFVTNVQNRTEFAQATYFWKNASGDGITNLVVQQNGQTLSFYDAGNTLSLSAGLNPNTVSLNSFIASGATTDNLNQNECQFSTGLGYLFVVHPYCDPFYVQYNPGSPGTFTAAITIFTIRDFTGLIEAGVLTDNRPTTLTANHSYNLYNQGWSSANTTTFHTGASAYPSNADVWWIFKDSTNSFVVNATTLVSNSRASTPAPQGYFRLNPWNTARQATALAQAGASLTLTGSNIDQSSGTLRPSVTEFHAGRVWYSGVNANGYTGLIYFSRVVSDSTDFGFCSSTNDPTSETLFDFLASDGGIIAIPQAGTIYRMISMGPNLLVFGANGVWAISGSRGIGFAANDYSVANISYDRSISGTSFVVVGTSVMWWNISDINVLTNNQTGYQVQSLSYEKIKDFYVAIPSQGKKTARGVYNPRTHLVEWVYRVNNIAGLTDTYTYDSMLTFNTMSSAFYPWTVDTSQVTINSIVAIDGSGASIGSKLITDNALDTVLDNNGDNVGTYSFAATTFQTTTKYLVSYAGSGTYTFTFAENFSPLYLDWVVKTTTGLDYPALFTTGYQVKTQGEREFQSNYIFVFTDLSQVVNEGFPSYVFQSQWDYGAANTTGQFTQRQTIPQTITHNETNYAAARRRLKVRGAGESLQFTFTGRTGLPFHIIGWSTFDTSNAKP